MSPGSYFIIGVMIVFALIILTVSAKTGKLFRCLMLSAFSGIGSLFAVNIASYITGVTLAVNPVTLLISGIGGVPGTIALLLGNIILS